MNSEDFAGKKVYIEEHLRIRGLDDWMVKYNPNNTEYIQVLRPTAHGWEPVTNGSDVQYLLNEIDRVHARLKTWDPPPGKLIPTNDIKKTVEEFTKMATEPPPTEVFALPPRTRADDHTAWFTRIAELIANILANCEDHVESQRAIEDLCWFYKSVFEHAYNHGREDAEK